MEIDLLDKFHKASKGIEEISYDIQFKANAFKTIGNENMYIELSTMAECIRELITEIRDAVHESIHKEFQQAQHQTARVLETFLSKI